MERLSEAFVLLKQWAMAQGADLAQPWEGLLDRYTVVINGTAYAHVSAGGVTVPPRHTAIIAPTYIGAVWLTREAEEFGMTGIRDEVLSLARQALVTLSRALYKPMTAGELIEALRQLPRGAEIRLVTNYQGAPCRRVAPDSMQHEDGTRTYFVEGWDDAP